MKYITTTQAAEMLQVSIDTVIRLIRSGDLIAERATPRGPYRIDERGFADYVSRMGITLKRPPGQ